MEPNANTENSKNDILVELKIPIMHKTKKTLPKRKAFLLIYVELENAKRQ